MASEKNAGESGSPSPVRLLSLATANPRYVLRQPEVRRRAAALFGGRTDIDRLLPVFENAGIETRYSCVPVEWYLERHGWEERTALYVEHSLNLLEEVASGCLERAGLEPRDIDAVVVASTTGVATPSLDALLAERLPLRRDVQRLPIFGLGCAGGVLGLARAASLARAQPGSRVLFLVVELCGLTFRPNDISKSNLVAAALFGDGAASAILTCGAEGLAVGASGEHSWPASLDIMGWEVQEDGLKARFSRDIPSLVRDDFRSVTGDFLARHGLGLEDIGAFACHPGGAKVLDELEFAFELDAGALVESRSVLRDYGNMSAPTALFVLDRLDPWARSGRVLMTALGPGFTAAFLVLENR